MVFKIHFNVVDLCNVYTLFKLCGKCVQTCMARAHGCVVTSPISPTMHAQCTFYHICTETWGLARMSSICKNRIISCADIPAWLFCGGRHKNAVLPPFTAVLVISIQIHFQ